MPWPDLRLRDSGKHTYLGSWKKIIIVDNLGVLSEQLTAAVAKVPTSITIGRVASGLPVRCRQRQAVTTAVAQSLHMSLRT